MAFKAAVLIALLASVIGAAAEVSQKKGNGDGASDITQVVPWSEYFFQSFYHASILPLLCFTMIAGWLARPSTTEVMPPGFRTFQWFYLSVWCVCVAADWLQGPYVYALYSAYGFNGGEIAELFVAGFGASLVSGMFVGSFADRFGRKKMCIMYCFLYIVSCMTKHFKNYNVLMFGRLTGGIATSILFSCFECWMVAESCARGFSGGLLSYMFGQMFSLMYCVAILSGLIAQFAADSVAFVPISEGSMVYRGGYTMPFDLAIGCLVLGTGMIAFMWKENYGQEEGEEKSGVMQNLGDAFQVLYTDRRTWLLCLVVSCFEGAMFAFVFNWTPALESKAYPPPYGVIFALFMMACMIGASLSTLTDSFVKPLPKCMFAFALGILSFGIAAFISSSHSFLGLVFAAFLLFEFCCGIYFPSVGVLKSEIVPERVRGTMYNIYRIPLNAIVVALLLSNISMVRCFGLCASLLTISLICAVCIGMSSPSAKGEKDHLLSKTV